MSPIFLSIYISISSAFCGLRYLLIISILFVAVLAKINKSNAAPDLLSAQPGQVFQDCPDCPEMVVVPAGSFEMGSSQAEADLESRNSPNDVFGFVSRAIAMERPQHIVTFTQPFAIGKYPVTKGEFAAFIHDSGYSPEPGCVLSIRYRYSHSSVANWQNSGFSQTDRDPVVCVNWKDAQAYVAWLNRKINQDSGLDSGGYQLPSEAEWEYVARAGTRTIRWWGDVIGPDKANCRECGGSPHATVPVGRFGPNPFGVYDLLGNAWQWTEDCEHDTYVEAPTDGQPWLGRVDGLRQIDSGGFRKLSIGDS